MATYGTLIQRIIDELPRADSSITQVVQQQILSAVDFYSTKRFWFNEKYTTLTTSPSLALYSFSSDMLEVDSVKCTAPGGSFYELESLPYKTMDAMDNGRAFGQPQWYSTYGKQFRLYPVPDATYTFIVSHQYFPATLSASTDSNPWTNEAEALIRARAMAYLHGVKFKNQSDAMIAQEMERQELGRLTEQTEKLLGIGRIEGSGI